MHNATEPLTNAAPIEKKKGEWVNLISWVVLFVGLAGSALTWLVIADDEKKSAERRFVIAADERQTAVKFRMSSYEQALLSGVALFGASDEVTRERWRAFNAGLRISTRYPGIQGVGWSVVIPPEQLEAHVRAIRAEGYPDYHVRPSGARDFYTSIIYLEPFDWRNQRAFGFDMFSEPVRRQAMELARDTGEAALSGKVTLVQETESEPQAGTLMYLPVYRQGAPRDTVAARRAALVGFVYSPFRMNDLMRGVIGATDPVVALRIYDGETSDASALMYDSHRNDAAAVSRSTLRRTEVIDLANHRWTLEFRSTNLFEDSIDRTKPLAALSGGVTLSLMLFGAIWALSHARFRAVQLAHQMTAEFRNSEARTTAIVNTVVDGIITIDTAGTVQTFNPAAARIFGYRPEEVVGRNVKMLMPEPHRGAHDQYLSNYLATGEAKIIGIGRELIGRRKDGSDFPMELTVNEMNLAGAQMFAGVVRDITERKQTQEALSAIIAAIHKSQMVAEFKMGGTLIAANDHFCDVLGYELNEVLGQHHSLFVPRDWLKSDEHRGFWPALNRGESLSAESKYIAKSGEDVWLQVVYTPVLDSLGRPFKVFLFATNVTENFENVSRLKDSETRTRTIVESAIDGIITFDLNGVIESFNPAAARIFGREAGEVIGGSIEMLSPEALRIERDGHPGAFLTVDNANVAGAGSETIGQRKDGTTFPMEVSVSEMKMLGRRMFIAIVRDITDRKQADKMKREFVSTVSHELRTPLTSIKGSLGLIRSGAIGNLPDKLGKMLEIAYTNSDRLVRLINDILDIEKIEAGKMDFRMEALDLVSLLKQAVEANRDYGREFGVEFALTLDLHEAPVLGDQDRLMQVLANLMSNAAKFSPKGSVVELSVSRSDGRFAVQVVDTGPGIPLEFRDRIFGKFSQADSSDTRQKGGTGLGLSITKAIVERHGGTVGFKSEIGQGSTFYFDLPIRMEAGKQQAVAMPEAETGFHILICEDDVDNASLLEILMEQAGYSTDTARNAAEAEAFLARNTYDAMTLDIGLPDKDGLALLDEIKANPKTRNLPIIIVSARSPGSAKGKYGGAIGIVDWIKKPIDQHRLAESLRAATGSLAKDAPNILHVEDDRDVVNVVSALVGNRAVVTPAATLSAAEGLLRQRKFDLLIVDLALPDGDGGTLLSLLPNTRNKGVPVIIFSASDISRQVTETIRAALVKSTTSNELLLNTIRSSIAAHRNIPLGK